jgi:hypothetical protein
VKSPVSKDRLGDVVGMTINTSSRTVLTTSYLHLIAVVEFGIAAHLRNDNCREQAITRFEPQSESLKESYSSPKNPQQRDTPPQAAR